MWRRELSKRRGPNSHSNGKRRAAAAMTAAPRIRAEIPGREQQRQTESKFGPHPEGKVARPHRCNDRLEDLIQALFEGDPRKNLPGPARLFYECLQSNPGEEPSDPFFYLKIDPPGAVKKETPE